MVLIDRYGPAAMASRWTLAGVRQSGRNPAGRVVLAVGLSMPLRVRLVRAVRTAPAAPVLDQVIGVANADCAGRQEVTGRFRLSPVTGHVAAARAQDMPVDLPLEPFALARFDRWASSEPVTLHGQRGHG